MSANVSSSASSPVLPSLKSERIQLWLRGMPGWNQGSNSLHVLRRFTFGTRSESLAFLRLATEAVAAMEVPYRQRGPAIVYRGDQVTVSIWAHHGCFSGSDLELARAISQLN